MRYNNTDKITFEILQEFGQDSIEEYILILWGEGFKRVLSNARKRKISTKQRFCFGWLVYNED